jgi:hypothetical protein
MTEFQPLDDKKVREMDIAQFEWDDLMDGTLTMEQGAVLKYFVDQMNSDQTVLLREQLSCTGKTAKFILDNSADKDNIPKIVCQDTFVNTFLYCDDFFDNVEFDSRVYKNPQPSPEIIYDMTGNPTSTQTTFPDGYVSVVDLTNPPPERTQEELGNFYSDSVMNPSLMVNSNGDAYGNADDDFKVDLAVYFPFPVSLGFLEHEKDGICVAMATMYNRLKPGGVLLVFDNHFPKVDKSIWKMLEAVHYVNNLQDPYQKQAWSFALNSEIDNTGYWKAIAIQRNF